MNELFAQLRANLMQQFRGIADLEDVVQEALLRTHKRLSGVHNVQDVSLFATGVARNIIFENLRGAQHSFQVAAMDAAPEAAIDPPQPELSFAVLEELARAVLSASERKLFLEYFQAGAKRERLAKKRGVTVAHLYVMVHRFKQRLIAEHRRRKGIQP